MRTSAITRFLGLALLAAMLVAPGAQADVRKRCEEFCEKGNTISLRLDLDTPFVNRDAGFVPEIGIYYRVMKHLGIGLGLGYAVSETGDSFPGNFVLSVNTTWWTHNPLGANAYLGGSMNVGLGLFDPSGDRTNHALEMGQVVTRDWLMFLPAAVVLEPRVIGGVTFGGSSLTFALGPAFGLPIYHQDTRNNQTGLEYRVHLNGGFGDFRGAFLVTAGVSGIAELDGSKKNNVSLDLSMMVYLGSIHLNPYIACKVPLGGLSADTTAILSFGAAWKFDVLGGNPTPLYEED